ncbi:Zinc finger protein ZOP1 [Camellia lanceoleosa]|uniref:Zinc finger protein ZOP1 n=1 Tax=Camellia lanceoleosa TaxID=1840588 RepID=A0ACC0GW40_9ERIC|nr:Zinc finger protein ZOP1 [Camellia lanceoleosa]
MQPGLHNKAELIEWEYDSSSGYYCNQNNGCFYDPNSGFYYTDALVVSAPLNPKRSVKGALSSLTVNKRKRQDEKSKVLSKEETVVLKKKVRLQGRELRRERSRCLAFIEND